MTWPYSLFSMAIVTTCDEGDDAARTGSASGLPGDAEPQPAASSAAAIAATLPLIITADARRSAHGGHRGLRTLFHLRRRDVLEMGGNHPLVPERVDHLAGAVAPEHVLHGPRERAAGVDRALHGRIDV